MIIKQDDALFLLCGEQIAIELKTGRSKIPAPDNLQSEYQRRKPSPEHFVEDSFVLNEYQVRHKGEWGYICQKDGQDIWTFGGRGYLYTDMQREGDNLYFGTAGAGGYFYILNIHTGVPILSLRTGGTTVIQRRGSHAYLYTGVGQRKSQLICVDLISGSILDEIELPGIASDRSALGMRENHVYTITFTYKKRYGAVKDALYSCIALDYSCLLCSSLKRRITVSKVSVPIKLQNGTVPAKDDTFIFSRFPLRHQCTVTRWQNPRQA